MWHPRREHSRPAFRQYGYDARWHREAEQYRRHNPLCIGCFALGRRVKADVVDHIIPHRGDQRLFRAVCNWQSACQWHHNAIKPELERLFLRGQLTAEALQH